MAIVDQIDIIRNTDRQFDLQVFTSDGTTKKLDDADLVLKLRLPSEDEIAGQDYLELTETVNANGSKIEVTDAPSGVIKVTLGDADTALLKAGDGQNMELSIQEGPGPTDFNLSKVQYEGQLNVKKCLFPET